MTLHLRIHDSRHGRSKRGIGRLYRFFFRHGWHADDNRLLFGRCQYAGFHCNDQPSDQRCLRSGAEYQREHHLDCPGGSDGQRANQRYWRERILWRSYICVFRFACKYQLQLQSGNRHRIWHAGRPYTAFSQHGREFDDRPAKTEARRLCLRSYTSRSAFYCGHPGAEGGRIWAVLILCVSRLPGWIERL